MAATSVDYMKDRRGMADDLSSGSVHLWIYAHPLEEALAGEGEGLKAVSDAEMERAQRFHFARDRQQFLASRILLRQALTHYVPQVEPRDWAFAALDKGKPYISRPTGCKLQFNMSHTRGMIALAFALGSIGVDAEWVDRAMLDMEGTIPKFFEAFERAYLGAYKSEGWQRRFLDIWTLKEARLKASGLGLSGISESGDLAFDGNGILSQFATLHRWRLWQADIGADHKLALAYPVTATRVATFLASPTQSPTECSWIQPNWQTLE
jgi:4'-phosphopantetheinyl transferase